MPQVLESPMLAYVPQRHTFRVILRDRLDQEDIYTIPTDSDRVCNVLNTIRALYPGRSVVDLWEVA